MGGGARGCPEHVVRRTTLIVAFAKGTTGSLGMHGLRSVPGYAVVGRKRNAGRGGIAHSEDARTRWALEDLNL